VADWFTARGFQAFILQYRLSSNGSCSRCPCSMRSEPCRWCGAVQPITTSTPTAS
jgi:hypothetical protein